MQNSPLQLQVAHYSRTVLQSYLSKRLYGAKRRILMDCSKIASKDNNLNKLGKPK